MLAFDRECRYTLWNPAMESISGVSRKEALGQVAFDLFPFLRETGEDQFFYAALAGQTVITKDRRYTVPATGREGFFEGHYAPLYDESGEVIGGFAIIREITEHKLAEEALRESEKRYRDLVEHSLGLISTHDLDGQLISINPAAARLLGYEPAEMIGRNFREFVAPSMQNYVGDYLARMRHEPSTSGLMRVVTKSGEELIWLYRNLRHEEAGKRPYIIGHAQDITQRVRAERALRTAYDEMEARVEERTLELKMANAVLEEQIAERVRAERALRESELRFRSIFENVTIGLYRTTPDGHILLANPTLVQMLGYNSFEEMARRNLEQEGFEPGYSRSEFKMRIERDGEIKGLEVSWTRFDGSVIAVRESARSIRDSRGDVLYYEGTVEDITERKRSEEALRRLADRLTTAQEDERRRISRELHDEAGQALTAIAVRLHMLERKLSDVNLNGTRVSTELGQLRAIAESTQEELRRMAHALHPSVLEHLGLTEALRSFVKEIGTYSAVKFSLLISQSFPRLSQTVESAVYRIVQEAVTNALKHAEARTISLEFTATPETARVTIRDDGCGFDVSTAEARGGVGVVSMRERAEMIGMELSISSGDRAGTLVTLSVPFANSSSGMKQISSTGL